MDVDSLLDTNQPDFFLRIEMPKAAGSAKPDATPDPEAARDGSAEAAAKPEIKPSPQASSVPYEWHMFAEEQMQPTQPPAVPPAQKPETAAAPVPAGDTAQEPASDRMQIVADALYHAPRLAQQGRYRQALEVVDAALGVDERVAPLHALRGSLCYKLGRERQAEEGWARALELDPRLSDARQALDWIRNRRR